MDQMLVDYPSFYHKVCTTADKLNNEMIVVGDFNLVIDPAKDYYSYLHVNNSKAREAVLEQMHICNLTDVSRDFHSISKKIYIEKNTPS